MADRVTILETPDELAARAAERIGEIGRAALGAGGRFRLALAGGSTPRPTYARLAEPPARDQLDWARVDFFWTDERCVPPDHPESNYRMVQEALLSRIPVPPANIYRMHGEARGPEDAAQNYQAALCGAFELREGFPRFDLILLGLGPEGHTASLFPGSPALQEHRHLVVAVRVERLNAWRLTLTPPVINAARHILFLVAGAEKAESLRQVLDDPADIARLPAQVVRPADGMLEWLIDREAARLLQTR